MTITPVDDVQQRIDAHRTKTAETWQYLLLEDFAEGSPLDVDLFFEAEEEAGARALAAELAAADRPVSVGSRRSGLLRKTTTWLVQTSEHVPAATADELDALVERMVRLAAGHGAVFDGWGAELQGDQFG